MLKNYFCVIFSYKYLFLIFIISLVEAIIVNTSFINYLYFFPSEGSSERALNFGFYQRPLGICGNSSMTSCTLIFGACLLDSFLRLNDFPCIRRKCYSASIFNSFSVFVFGSSKSSETFTAIPALATADDSNVLPSN